VLNRDTVELVLVEQKRWEESEVGQACVSLCLEDSRQTELTHSLLRGIVKPRNRRAKGAFTVNVMLNNSYLNYG